MVEQEGIILITGACGRIACKSVEVLCNAYKIVGFDLSLTADIPEIELIGVDMASEESIDEGLKILKSKYGNKIVSLLHLASFHSLTSVSWHQFERVTIDGTERLFRSLRKHQFEVGQFVFTSTMLVHSPTVPGKKIHETSPIAPKWNFPKSKVLIEDLIHRMQGDIPSVILRIAGVYGQQCQSSFIAHLMKKIYEKKWISHFFPGDLTHGASFIHIDDVVCAIQKVIAKRNELPHELVLLLGEERTYSYKCLMREMGRYLHGRLWTSWSVPKWLAKVGIFCIQHMPLQEKSFIRPWMVNVIDDHYELDVSRAKKILDWTPKHALIDFIPIWAEQLKKEPIAWYIVNKLKIQGKMKEESS